MAASTLPRTTSLKMSASSMTSSSLTPPTPINQTPVQLTPQSPTWSEKCVTLLNTSALYTPMHTVTIQNRLTNAYTAVITCIVCNSRHKYSYHRLVCPDNAHRSHYLRSAPEPHGTMSPDICSRFHSRPTSLISNATSHPHIRAVINCTHQQLASRRIQRRKQTSVHHETIRTSSIQYRIVYLQASLPTWSV